MQGSQSYFPHLITMYPHPSEVNDRPLYKLQFTQYLFNQTKKMQMTNSASKAEYLVYTIENCFHKLFNSKQVLLSQLRIHCQMNLFLKTFCTSKLNSSSFFYLQLFFFLSQNPLASFSIWIKKILCKFRIKGLTANYEHRLHLYQ